MATEKNGTEQASQKKGSERPEAKVEQLREEISRTRAALSEDVKALSQRLNPAQLKEDAKEVIHHAADAAREGAKHLVRETKDAAVDLVRETKDAAVDSLRYAKEHAFDSIYDGAAQVGRRARSAGHSVSDFVGSHALPLALLGAGAGWLLVSMNYKRRLQLAGSLGAGPRYASEQAGVLEHARERAGELAGQAQSALSHGAHRIAERAHDLQSGLGERASALRSELAHGAAYVGHEAAELGRQAYDGIEWAGTRAVAVGARNPWTTGLLALAAGAAVAMLLPPTRRENELLGQTRDRLLDKAQHSARELKSSVQRSASDAREVIDEIRHPGSSHV